MNANCIMMGKKHSKLINGYNHNLEENANCHNSLLF